MSVRGCARWDTARRRAGAMVLVVALVAAAHAMPGAAPVRAEAQGWTPAASMSTSRYRAGATLLTAPACSTDQAPAWCGKVLVMGGLVPGAVPDEVDTAAGISDIVTTDSSELFSRSAGNAGSGSWSSCSSSGVPSAACPGAMNVHRTRPVATALEDGRVLVTGGKVARTGQLDAPDAEVYDPATGTWARTTPPGRNLGDSGSTAAALLTGPACQPTVRPGWCGKVLVVSSNSANQRWAMLFDPAGTDAEGRVGTWTGTAAPHGLHGAPTLTTLADGRVVLVGGSVRPEVYTPPGFGQAGAPAAWAETGPMTWSDRVNHSASLLTGPLCRTQAPPSWCGKVLVAGGARAVDGPPIRSDLFDPAGTGPAGEKGSWVATGALPDAKERFKHHAAPLADGTVLVAGGTLGAPPGQQAGSNDVVPGTARYEPASGEWTGAGVLDDPRQEHVLVALATGGALVAGGQGTVRLSSAELFSPGTIEATGPPPQVRSVTPDKVPADGATEIRVTIKGAGFGGGLREVRFGSQPAGSVEPDPADPNNTLFATAPASTAPGPVAVTVSTDTGGVSLDPVVFTYAAVTGGAWEAAALLTEDRVFATATMVDGARVLVAGGWSNKERFIGQESRASAELYEPAGAASDGAPVRGRWVGAGSMLAPRFLHTATLLADGTVLVAGGIDDPPGDQTVGFVPAVLSSAERWRSADRDGTTAPAGAWVPAGAMSVPRAGHTATALAGEACRGAPPTSRVSCGDVLVVGGDEAGTVELYDHETGAWLPAPALGAPRTRHTATLLADGRVLVVGGEFRDPSRTDGNGYTAWATAEVWDPRGPDRWSPAAGMLLPRTRHTATLLADGRLLVAGGGRAAFGALNPSSDVKQKGPAHASAEIYDPSANTWAPESIPLFAPREGHSASLLPSGRVLVAGGLSERDLQFSAEIFDPSLSGGKGGFVPAPVLVGGIRVYHAAVVLPDGLPEECGSACGTVLVAGGFAGATSATAELFFPTPEIAAVTPDRGVTSGGTAVTITGTGLAGVTEPSQVLFGDTFARSVAVESDRRIVAVSPRTVQPGPVNVRVTGPGGTSAIAPVATFTYFVLDRVLDLAALADSETSATLTFTAPGDPPATRYVIKQSDSPITDDALFAAAEVLCGGVCEVPLGESVSFRVGGLSPGRTYHFALRALDAAGQPGPLSNPASVTTLVCPAPPAAGPGQVVYPSGYSLVGAPESSIVPAIGRLYGWFDRRAGAYSVQDVAEPVLGGRGYWAWFLCPRLVDLAGPGTTSASLPLGAYHASMVGNPSATGPVSVAGADYVARWLPGLNDGAGGYEISGIREPKTLAVGEGAWVFSFSETTVRIGSP